jgi:hypothetical protein
MTTCKQCGVDPGSLQASGAEQRMPPQWGECAHSEHSRREPPPLGGPEAQLPPLPALDGRPTAAPEPQMDAVARAFDEAPFEGWMGADPFGDADLAQSEDAQANTVWSLEDFSTLPALASSTPVRSVAPGRAGHAVRDHSGLVNLFATRATPPSASEHLREIGARSASLAALVGKRLWTLVTRMAATLGSCALATRGYAARSRPQTLIAIAILGASIGLGNTVGLLLTRDAGEATRSGPPRAGNVEQALPQTPSRDQVMAALSSARTRVARCKGPGTANVSLRVIGPTGRVSNVAVEGVGGDSRACVESAIRQTAFPKFQQQLRVEVPFKLEAT